MPDERDPSERPTMPPIADEPLPREQERLAVRFAADVARAVEGFEATLAKQGRANDLNWMQVKELFETLRGDIRRQQQFAQELDGRIERLERWRDSVEKPVDELLGRNGNGNGPAAA